MKIKPQSERKYLRVLYLVKDLYLEYLKFLQLKKNKLSN